MFLNVWLYWLDTVSFWLRDLRSLFWLSGAGCSYRRLLGETIMLQQDSENVYECRVCGACHVVVDGVLFCLDQGKARDAFKNVCKDGKVDGRTAMVAARAIPVLVDVFVCSMAKAEACAILDLSAAEADRVVVRLR